MIELVPSNMGPVLYVLGFRLAKQGDPNRGRFLKTWTAEDLEYTAKAIQQRLRLAFLIVGIVTFLAGYGTAGLVVFFNGG